MLKKKRYEKKAYSLKPFIMVGQQGLTDADIALNAHKLIKVRIRGADKNKRTEQCAQIENELNAEVVDQIGGITVLFRPATASS